MEVTLQRSSSRFCIDKDYINHLPPQSEETPEQEGTCITSLSLWPGGWPGEDAFPGHAVGLQTAQAFRELLIPSQ